MSLNHDVEYITWSALHIIHLTFKGAQTALSAASSRGHFEVAELLLDSGASVNAVDDVSVLLTLYVTNTHCASMCFRRSGLLYMQRLLRVIRGWPSY